MICPSRVGVVLFASLAVDELLPICIRNISTKLWAYRSFWVLLLSRIVAKMSCLCIYYLGRGSSCLGVLGCNGTTTSPQSARFRAGACVSTTLSVIELLFFARDAVERQSRKIPRRSRTQVRMKRDATGTKREKTTQIQRCSHRLRPTFVGISQFLETF